MALRKVCREWEKDGEELRLRLKSPQRQCLAEKVMFGVLKVFIGGLFNTNTILFDSDSIQN